MTLLNLNKDLGQEVSTMYDYFQGKSHWDSQKEGVEAIGIVEHLFHRFKRW